MKYEVVVQLKRDVLDPEGRTIQHNLERLGFKAIQEVTVTKRYVVDVDEDTADSDQMLDKIAKKYLSNPTSQTYTLTRLS